MVRYQRWLDSRVRGLPDVDGMTVVEVREAVARGEFTGAEAAAAERAGRGRQTILDMGG
jgi:hypothetical protein